MLLTLYLHVNKLTRVKQNSYGRQSLVVRGLKVYSQIYRALTGEYMILLVDQKYQNSFKDF
jgi:hypothetical protein